jgi:hypothetical protein
MARPSAVQIRARVLAQLSGTALDTQLDAAIAAAEGHLARYCLFPEYASGLVSLDKDVSTAYTLYLNGPDRRDSRQLRLRLRPIVSITSVAQDITRDLTYSEALVQGTDYTLDTQAGVLDWHPNSSKPFISGRRSIKVVCVAGFDLDNHETLMQAIALTVSHWWTYKGVAPSLQNITQGGQTAQLIEPRAIPPLVRDMMAPYVLWEREGADGIR